ncbi:MAG TPA: hypothetical protein VF533_21215 [Solirubrobacteraceae bacterium]|jgi:hypothetical protein
MGTMLDTIGDPRTTFADLQVEAVAGYGNGKWPTFAAAKREFPHAHHIEIDVNGAGIGDAGDFENGDMAASEAGSWAKRRIEAGVHRPVIYFSVSSWGAVIESLHAAGLHRRDVRIWTAHYNGRPHLCDSSCEPGIKEPADATQWGSAQAPNTLPHPYAGRNIDVSETSPSFF